jgi:hypothetical protein
MPLKPFLRYAFILFLAVIIGAGTLEAAGTLTMNPSAKPGATGSVNAPRGQKVSVLTFSLKAVGGDATFTTISVQNTGTSVYFGNGVSEVAIYKQTASESFDGTQTKLGSVSYAAPAQNGTAVIGLSDAITSGNTTGYFVVYTIDDTATLTTTPSGDVATTTVGTILSINDGAVTLVAPVTHTPTLSGYKLVKARSILPSVVVPGQLAVPVMAVSIKAVGEAVDKDIELKFLNTFANYVTVTGNTNGVIKAYLVQDFTGTAWKTTTLSSGERAALDAEIAAPGFLITSTGINSSRFSSASGLTFSFPGTSTSSDLRFPLATSANFLLVYDLGETFTITSDTKIEAKLVSISGKGSVSNLTVADTKTYPTVPPQAPVAGLAYTGLSKIAVNGNFGSGATLPILEFFLRAYQATMDVTQVSIGNPQATDVFSTVPFITDTTGVDGVTRIDLYSDNGNGKFDGVGSTTDTLIGKILLGTSASLNQDNRADIRVSANSQAFFRVKPFDKTAVGYPQDNSKKVFAIYYLGSNLLSTRTSVTSQLANSKGFAHIDEVATKSVVLSGTKPAVASPAATVTISRTNVFISSSASAAPSPNRVVKGQQKVPMLAISVRSDNVFPSASITITNESGTYFTNGRGVSKVWLYKDSAPLGTFDSNDTYISSNGSLVNSSQVTLPGLALDTGLNYFLVLYDIGQNATLDTDITKPSVRAQLSAMASVGTTSLLLGGEVPNPKTPAMVAIGTQNASIRISSEAFSETATFTVRIAVKNLTSSTMTIQDVRPRFYSGAISGVDVSNMFNYVLSPALALSVPANQTVTFSFAVKLVRPTQVGTVIGDGYLKYLVGTNEAVLTRYQGDSTGGVASWFSAAVTPLSLNIQSANPNYTWSLPQYISKMTYKAGVSATTETPFQNQNAVPPNSSLVVYLRNPASLDASSFTIKLNNTALPQVDNPGSSSSYRYSSSAGTLTVSSVGTTDGTLSLDLKDLEGVSLQSASITFLVSEPTGTLRLTNPLFYPSPYNIGKQLMLGFNLTKKATVYFYMFNHLGQEIWRSQKQFSTPGYKLLANTNDATMSLEDATFLSGLANIISSGVYVCKMIAVDDTGNRITASTKLAVY